jgi:hypothetical protein
VKKCGRCMMFQVSVMVKTVTTNFARAPRRRAGFEIPNRMHARDVAKNML